MRGDPRTLVRFTILQAAAAIAAYVLLAVFWGRSEHLARITYPLCVFMVVGFCWSIWSWRQITGEWIDVYSYFLAALTLFSGGQCFLEAFGLNECGILGTGLPIPLEAINRSVLLVAVSLVFLQLGALLGLRVSWHRGARARTPRSEQDVQCQAISLRTIGLLLIAIGVLPMIHTTVDTMGYSFANGYFALYGRQVGLGDALLRALSKLYIVGAIMLLAGSLGRRAPVSLSWCLVLTYAVCGLAAGNRGDEIMAICAMLWVHHSAVRRMSALRIAVIALVILMAIPIVKTTRGMTGKERISAFSTIWTRMPSPNPVVPAFQEMGGSLGTIALTIALVPASRDHEYGGGYAFAAVKAIPFRLWTPEFASGYQYPSEWLVWEVAPTFAAQGGGLDFSAIAEAYLNFSWQGTPFVCAIIGFALGGLAGWARDRSDLLRLAVAAIAVTFVPIFARSHSANLVKPVLFCGLVPLLICRWLYVRFTRLQTQRADPVSI